MTLTIEISPELENKLEAEAENKGIGTDEFVRIVLEEKLNLQPSGGKKPTFESKILATDLPLRDSTAEHRWLKENREEFSGQWVALDGDTLIASGLNAKDVGKTVREVGLEGLFFTFVEPDDQPPFISGGLWRE